MQSARAAGNFSTTRWVDIDWSTNKIRIERSLYQVKQQIGIKPTKTRQERLVSVPPSLIEYLKLHRESPEKYRELLGPDYRTGRFDIC